MSSSNFIFLCIFLLTNVIHGQVSAKTKVPGPPTPPTQKEKTLKKAPPAPPSQNSSRGTRSPQAVLEDPLKNTPPVAEQIIRSDKDFNKETVQKSVLKKETNPELKKQETIKKSTKNVLQKSERKLAQQPNFKNGMYKIKKNCTMFSKATLSSQPEGHLSPGRKLWVEGHDEKWRKVYKKEGPVFIPCDCL